MAQSTTGKARDTVERLKPGDRELTPAAKTIAAAAAAAAAGGLAAALKALVEHRSDDNDDEGQRGDAEREEPEADDRRRDEPTATDDAQQDEEEEQDEPRSSRRDDDNDDDRRQGPEGGAARIVEAGRSELEALLGQQVESVSGFSRSDDGWCVTYEVVEMRRIPDSSDVLSSYAVVLDGDGDLMTLERKHRYRRAQVDEG